MEWYSTTLPLFRENPESESLMVYNIHSHHYYYYYVCRFSVRNILLCGIWYSRSKPENMHTFLKPVIDSINDLYTRGKISTVIQWTLQITDTLVHIGVVLYWGVTRPIIIPLEQAVHGSRVKWAATIAYYCSY